MVAVATGEVIETPERVTRCIEPRTTFAIGLHERKAICQRFGFRPDAHTRLSVAKLIKSFERLDERVAAKLRATTKSPAA